MYIIEKELFEKLPEEAQKMVQDEGQAVEDEAKMEQIEELVGEKEDEGEDKSEEMAYGPEGEYKDEVTDEGGLKELPESEKNSIKDFDAAADRGNSLIIAMSEKPKKEKAHGVNPIKKVDEENPKDVMD